MKSLIFCVPEKKGVHWIKLGQNLSKSIFSFLYCKVMLVVVQKRKVQTYSLVNCQLLHLSSFKFWWKQIRVITTVLDVGTRLVYTPL